VVGDTGFEPV